MSLRSTWLLAGAALALPVAAYAATITGEVTSEGHAVRGALVTLFTPDRLVSETVLTDAAGRYRMDTKWTGQLSLRARAPLSADSSVKLEVASPSATLNHRFALRRLTDPQEISDSLPASAHFARIRFPTTRARQQFQTDCTPCHATGGPLTRRPHSAEEWTVIMRRMIELADYTTQYHVPDYAAAMGHAFDGTPTRAHENKSVDEAALSARIMEWKLPRSEFPHDTAFYPPDGRFYTVDQFVDQIYITDPKTDESTVVPIPALGVPLGGSFAGANGVPDWVPHGVRHGNHSLTLSPFDGKFYITGSVGGEIGVFDPTTQSYEVHQIGGKAGWPHTIRFDSKGLAWFNTYLMNQIGSFDPKTGQFTIIELPQGAARRDDPKDQRIPAPYGLDVNPADDSIWYTQVWANKIGRVDPKTRKVTDWVPPVMGPHRARFDAAGGLWIPGLGDGTITRLDTKTMKYERFTIPPLAPDEVEAPYVLTVDPKTQDIWVSANTSDRMFRFVPSTRTWTAYPLPTRGVYFREIVITPDGRACATSSPIPPEQYGDDGITDTLICLQPERNAPGQH